MSKLTMFLVLGHVIANLIWDVFAGGVSDPDPLKYIITLMMCKKGLLEHRLERMYMVFCCLYYEDAC